MLHSIRPVLLLSGLLAIFSGLAASALAAPVSWTGGGDGVTWEDPANWSSDPALPGAADDVTINATTVMHTSEDTELLSLTCSADLQVTGGSITVFSDSEISGTLTVSPNVSMVADGAGTTFTFSGPATVNGAYLESFNGGSFAAPQVTAIEETRLLLRGAGATAELPALTSIDAARIQMYDGATFVIPAGVTSYTWFGGLSFFTPEDIFLAMGAGSMIDASSLTSVTATFGGLGTPTLQVRALDGGHLDFSEVVTIAGGGSGANGGGPCRIQVTNGGTYDFAALETITGNGFGVEFDIDAGTFTLPAAHTMTRVRVPLDSAVTFNAPALTAFTERCILTLSDPGAAFNAANLTNIDRSSIHVSNGTSWTLPSGVTTFNGDGGMGVNEARVIMQVSGSGSSLDASSLTQINATFGGLGGIRQRLEALDGGHLDLGSVTSITGGGSGANGGGPIDLVATNGGTMELGALETLTGVNNGARVRPEGGVITMGETSCNRTRIEMVDGEIVATGIDMDGESAIRGRGLLTCNVITDGVIQPDFLITVDGDLSAFGDFGVDLGGENAGVDHDTITVTGLADLGGTVTVGLAGGYAVPQGAMFDIITSAGLTDASTLVDNTGAGLVPSVSATTLTLTAPMPAAPDLVVTTWTVPTSGLVDQNVSVTFEISNSGDAIATGSWQDRLYLSDDMVFDAGDDQIREWTFNGPLEVGESYSRQRNVRLPETPGTYYMIVLADANDTVAELAGESNNESISPPVEAVVESNLIVAAVSGPVTVAPGAPASVSWTVRNDGEAAASGPWTDAIYASDDSDVGMDTLLAEFVFEGTLGPGESVVRSESVTMPMDVGVIRVVACADSNDDVDEFDNDDNCRVAGSSTQVGAADYVVLGINGPTFGLTGEAFTLEWTIRNDGIGRALRGGRDGVWLSDDDTFDMGEDLYLGDFSGTALDPGETYSRSRNFDFPLTPGMYRIFIVTDVNNNIAELDGEGNNTGGFGPIDVQSGLRPDLAITSVTAPGTVTAGQSITIEYTAENAGTDSALNSWTDAIYVSDSPATRGGYGTLLRLDPAAAHPLDPAETYARSRNVTIPTSFMSGTAYITVVTDHNNAIDELLENNNATSSTAVNVLPPDAPDLSVAIATPAAADFGQTITLDWTVTNNGSADAAGGWADAVFLSDDTVLDGGDPLLLSRSGDAPLGVGNSYNALQDLALPISNDLPSGNYFFFIVTDNGDNLDETDESNNTVRSGSVALTRPPLPDLVVNSIDPISPAAPGEMIDVTFVVANNGPVDFDGTFTSVISIASPSRGSGLAAAAVDFTGVITSGGTSTPIMATFSLPDVSSAEFIASINVDAANDVIEGSEINNSGETAPTTYIRADLVAIDVTGPATAVAEASATFDFTVRNDGIVAAAPAWVDTVYLSSDPVVGNDIPVGSRVNSAGLGAGNQYSASVTAAIPEELLGDYFIIVRTNTGGLLNEGTATTNNTFISTNPISISQPDRPNLVVTDIAIPSDELSGRGMEVSWTVMNLGDGLAPGLWLDRVYASTNDELDDGDLLLGEQLRTMALDSGEMYTGMLMTQAPSLPGDYTLIVVTDAADSVNEGVTGDEDDNVSAAIGPFHVDTFDATAMADITAAPGNTPVTISGVATVAGTSTPAAEVPVVVRITTQGIERQFVAETDAAGAYSTIFMPATTEGGQYGVAAAPAHVTSPAIQDTFDLYTLYLNPDDADVETPAGIPTRLPLRLVNPGNHMQTGIAVNVISAPTGVTVTPIFMTRGGAVTISPNGFIDFELEIEGSVAVPTEALTLEVTSSEGGRAPLDISLLIGPPDAEVVAVEADLDMGVLATEALRDRVSYAQARLRNIGGLPSEPLHVELPASLNFVTLISPETIAPMSAGTEATIALRVAPSMTTPFGVVEDTIVVTDADGTGDVLIEIPVRVTVQSAATGDLLVYATDEFTYWAAGEPAVAGAEVTLFELGTFNVVAFGTTDADGYALIQGLTEGYYDVQVEAEDHGSFRANVLVDGGTTTEMEAFMTRTLITYTWTVEPIEFSDEYNITIEAEFATQVPAPVVILEPGTVNFSQLDYPTVVNFTLTNHGLITADDVQVGVDPPDGIIGTPLVEFLGDLPAMSTTTFPVLFTEAAPGSASRGGGGGGGCGAVSACYSLVCGDHVISYCVSSPGGACGGGGAVNPQGSPGGGGSINPQGTATIQQMGCGFNDCVQKCLLTQGGCIPGPVGCGFSLAGCGLSFEDNMSLKDDLKDLLGCAGAGVDCVLDTTVIYDIITCICKVLRDCNPNCEDFSGLPCSAGDLIPFIGNNIIDLFRSTNDELFMYTGRPEYDFFLDQYYGWSSYVVLLYEIYGDVDWLDQGPASAQAWRNWTMLFDESTADESEDAGYISAAERAALLALPRPNPDAVTRDHVETFIDRWNRSLDYYALDITTASELPEGWDPDFIDIGRIEEIYEYGVSAENAAAPIGRGEAAGFDSLIEALEYAGEVLRFERSQIPEGVCATVRIQLDQSATLTRRAFRATLELDNGTLAAMEDLTIDVVVRDPFGDDATDLFGLSNPEITGALDTVAGGTLPGESTGGARWYLLPSNDAAPSGETVYTVGGEIRYTYEGQQIVIPLYPVAILVVPNPELDLKYFLERVVHSDDPFTPVIEPTIPFSLGLLVENNGGGVARDLTITSSQPEIIENERGLLIDFDIIGSEVNNDSRQPSLTVTFDDILPSGSAVARWLLTATLQGEFVAYTASFEHVPPFDGSFNDPEFSLINSVDIFGLIHIVRDPAPGADNLFDFLTDDFPDVESLADRLHQSQGGVAPVVAHSSATVVVDEDNLEAMVTVPAPSGHVYVRIDDPFDAAYPLASVQRTDGQPIMLGWNAWITDRIDRRETGSPVKRYLHIFDHAGTGSYVVQYSPDGVAPQVTSWRSFRNHGSAGDVGLMLSAGTPQSDPRAGGISELIVEFSEPIDDASVNATTVNFDGTDGDGNAIDLSGIAASIELFTGEIGARITFTPPLPENGRYCVRLLDVTDRAGNQMDAGCAIKFGNKTSARPQNNSAISATITTNTRSTS